MTHDRLVFGVTIDQIDELNTLLRTITANGDALTFCNAENLQPQSVSTLGEAILDAGVAARDIFDQVNEQRLEQERASG
jgi:ssRNA-specific RNase YbeY (16S rRNA maturation enzyme)